MNLVHDWRNAPKWISMWCMAIFSGTTGAWAMMPAEWQSMILGVIPANWLLIAVASIGLAGMVGRVLDQGLKSREDV